MLALYSTTRGIRSGACPGALYTLRRGLTRAPPRDLFKDRRKLVPSARDVGAGLQQQLQYRRVAYPATVLELMNHTLEQKKGGHALPGKC